MKVLNIFLLVLLVIGFHSCKKKNSTEPQEDTSKLIAFYPFNGNANDESGNDYHGTVDGATLTNDRFENGNSAFGFDGTDDLINTSLSSIIEPEEFSVVAWIKTSETINSQSIISKYNHSSGSDLDDSFYLGMHNGLVKWQMNAGDSYSIIEASVNISNDQWHFLAGTWDGTNQIIYIDGAQDSVLTYSGTGHINNTNLPVIIGKTENQGGGPRYFNGVIDDIRLYEKALTADEIQTLYHEGGW